MNPVKRYSWVLPASDVLVGAALADLDHEQLLAVVDGDDRPYVAASDPGIMGGWGHARGAVESTAVVDACGAVVTPA